MDVNASTCDICDFGAHGASILRSATKPVHASGQIFVLECFFSSRDHWLQSRYSGATASCADMSDELGELGERAYSVNVSG